MDVSRESFCACGPWARRTSLALPDTDILLLCIDHLTPASQTTYRICRRGVSVLSLVYLFEEVGQLTRCVHLMVRDVLTCLIYVAPRAQIDVAPYARAHRMSPTESPTIYTVLPH